MSRQSRLQRPRSLRWRQPNCGRSKVPRSLPYGSWRRDWCLCRHQLRRRLKERVPHFRRRKLYRARLKSLEKTMRFEIKINLYNFKDDIPDIPHNMISSHRNLSPRWKKTSKSMNPFRRLRPPPTTRSRNRRKASSISTPPSRTTHTKEPPTLWTPSITTETER